MTVQVCLGQATGGCEDLVEVDCAMTGAELFLDPVNNTILIPGMIRLEGVGKAQRLPFREKYHPLRFY